MHCADGCDQEGHHAAPWDRTPLYPLRRDRTGRKGEIAMDQPEPSRDMGPVIAGVVIAITLTILALLVLGIWVYYITLVITAPAPQAHQTSPGPRSPVARRGRPPFYTIHRLETL
jgi:hypothetical protein